MKLNYFIIKSLIIKMPYDKTKIKPILINENICKMLHIPHKPHYKCYIRKKYSRQKYDGKKQISKYIYDYLENNTAERYYRWYVISQHGLIQYINKYFIDTKNREIKDIKLENNLKYTDEKIYLNIQSLPNKLLLIKSE